MGPLNNQAESVAGPPTLLAGNRESGALPAARDVVIPGTNTTPVASGTRPSRNRERISYSDFYRVGLGKIPSPVRSPVEDIDQRRKDKPNIIRLKVKGNRIDQEPVSALIEDHGEINLDESQKDVTTMLRSIEDSGIVEESDDVSEASILRRERAGTSPLSSVPSDIDDTMVNNDDGLSVNSIKGSDLDRTGRSHLHDVQRYATPSKMLNSSHKRPAPNSERSTKGSDKRATKSKKIKISSPVKRRKDSPVELELMPTDSKLKPKSDTDNRARSRDSDAGSNDGHCSACRGSGKLVCCDDCPRSFHFICIEPPIEESDIPDAPYFCMSCWDKRFGFPDPEPGIFHSLMVNELTRDPTMFQLPYTVRSFFDNVSSGALGVYQESKDQKTLRKDRQGFAEEADPHRLRDRQNRPVICYRCGESALGTPGIVSCDHCTAHWHFDCVDPPLHGPPNAYKNWMCPLHADDVTPTTRQPRGSRLIDVSLTRGFQNNGDIEIDTPDDAISSQPNSPGGSDSEPDVEDDIRWANATGDLPRIKYRIPARGVILDFLDTCRLKYDEEGCKILQAVPEISDNLETLVDVAMVELKTLQFSDRSSSIEERLQLLALKALIASKGKDKFMAFLEGLE